MFLLKTVAPWLLLVFLGLQVSPSCGARKKSRGEVKTSTLSTGRGPRSGDKPAAGRGKFSIKDKMQCTWGSKLVRGSVRLSVKCEGLLCHYNGNPQTCPGYLSDTEGYWKQVGASLRRLQGKVCQDEHALVRAAMCKRAPRDAHYKLNIRSIAYDLRPPSSVSVSPAAPRSMSASPAAPRSMSASPAAPRSMSASPAAPRSMSASPAAPRSVSASPAGPRSVSHGPTACARANHQQTAEETCSGSWVSVCNFFLSILQRDAC